jgi:CheY-like chemotaxis protein
MYREYLAYGGFRVVTASSGADAITVALMEKPNLIFMDLRMAHVNGSQAMQALQADPNFEKVPIVTLTAHAFDNERDEALQDGFDDLITKPWLPDDLAKPRTAYSRSRRKPLLRSASS